MIYLAGPCDTEHRTLMNNIANYVKELYTCQYEHKVYCPWELKIENAWDYTQEVWAKKVFDKDVEAINAADFVIMISVGRHSTAGTNWEQGYAYALRKPVYVIQITEETTSLMTYCGCKDFYNAGNNMKDIENALYQIFLDTTSTIQIDFQKHNCATTLT